MKAFFTVLLGLATLSAHAQITLEHTFAEQVQPFKLSTGDVKYAGLNRVTNQVRIYNANHSLYRQIPTGAPSGDNLYDLLSLSDRLFNNTPALEVVFNYIVQNSAGDGIAYLRVLDENGTAVLSVDSCFYGEAYNLPTGTKFLAYVQGAAQQATRVYSLPGTLTPLKTAGKSDLMQLSPFPNPASEAIRLPYQLGRGETGQLEVVDMTGRLVRKYTVDSSFNDLMLQAGELPAGVYTYRVNANTGITTGKKFVVRH